MVNLVYYCRLIHCQFCKHCCNSKICIRRASCRSLLWSLGTAWRNVEYLSMQVCRCHTRGTRAKWGTSIAIIHFSPLGFTPNVWPWQCRGAHICHTGLHGVSRCTWSLLAFAHSECWWTCSGEAVQTALKQSNTQNQGAPGLGPKHNKGKHGAKECWPKFDKNRNTLSSNSDNASQQQGNRLRAPFRQN